MKISAYLKHLESNDSNVVLMDAETGTLNNKDYTVAYTEAGEKHTFVKSNFKAALEEEVITPDGETIVIPRDAMVVFDSGLTHLQIGEAKAWSVDGVKLPK